MILPASRKRRRARVCALATPVKGACQRRPEMLVKKPAITMLLVAALGLFGAGCDDTIEGVEQDTEEGIQEMEESVDDEQGS